MFDTMMTVVGNVVDKPTLRKTKSDHWVANFRLASTPRRFDRDNGSWSDGQTLFVNVTAWRGLGANVAASLHRGDPVIVYGRYLQRNYVVDDKPRTAYELDAMVIGPDLNRGTAIFTRASRPTASNVDLDEDGMPVDASDEYIDFVEGTDEFVAEVDVRTGEVRELAQVP